MGDLAEPESAGKARVLIVDDEPVVLRTIRRIAARLFEVAEASDVEEARSRLADGTRWSAVVIDWRLQDRLGVEVLETARAGDPLLACALFVRTS